MMASSELQETLEQVLLQIKALQKDSGELPTQEFYPLDFPEKGWIDSIQSPFITSSALISLLEIETPVARSVKSRGAEFISGTREKNLWRFWDNNLAQNKVPLDADDSALCSFALSKISGDVVNNQKFFAANRNQNGLFYTWFLPRPVFLTSPLLYWQFMKDAKVAGNTILQQMLAPDDVEISVIANVLLYLGENSVTLKSIAFVENTLLGCKEYEQHFYDEPVFTWYHVSRAYKYGVKSFEKLKPVFAAFAKERYNSINRKTDLPLLVTLVNAAYNFGEPLASENLLKLAPTTTFTQKQAGAYPYFTSKNRRYQAGSPALTLAWYAEYLNNSLKELR